MKNNNPVPKGVIILRIMANLTFCTLAILLVIGISFKIYIYDYNYELFPVMSVLLLFFVVVVLSEIKEYSQINKKDRRWTIQLKQLIKIGQEE